MVFQVRRERKILLRNFKYYNSSRFCDSVWQLLLKNVEFLSNTGHLVARVEGKVGMFMMQNMI